jgi:hypothetical protein
MDTIGITLGTVDENTILDDKVKKALEPSSHIFMSQNAWWCRLNDGLPERDRFGGDFEANMNAWEGKQC